MGLPLYFKNASFAILTSTVLWFSAKLFFLTQLVYLTKSRKPIDFFNVPWKDFSKIECIFPCPHAAMHVKFLSLKHPFARLSLPW